MGRSHHWLRQIQVTGYGPGFHASHFPARYSTTPGGYPHIFAPLEVRINEPLDLEEQWLLAVRDQLDRSIHLTTDRVVSLSQPRWGLAGNETERVT